MKINRATRKSCEHNHGTQKCTKQNQITTKQSRKSKMHETSPNYNKTIAHNANARNKTKLQQSSRTTRRYMKKQRINHGNHFCMQISANNSKPTESTCLSRSNTNMSKSFVHTTFRSHIYANSCKNAGKLYKYIKQMYSEC